jgi:hypothetical protein
MGRKSMYKEFGARFGPPEIRPDVLLLAAHALGIGNVSQARF